MSKVILGKDESGRDVRLDLDKLVTTRLLIQGNSGGGKSWTIRRLLEQSHGKIQHIVLDPEGEFSTLREKYDYVLVGKGGEVGTDVRHAPKLAERLMELGASAVVDLYELKPDARRQLIDVDRDRSAEELGWHRNRDAALRLRDLEPGEFYAFGPALTNEVRRVRIGGVETSHPEIGTKAAPPPPPREKVRSMLSKLADLPKEAEEERQTVDSLQRRVRELEREIRQRPKVEVPQVKVERVEIPVLSDSQVKALDRIADTILKVGTNFATEAQAIRVAVAASSSAKPPIRPVALVAPIRRVARIGQQPPLRQQAENGEKLLLAERKVLTALAQYPQGRTTIQVAVLTSYAVNGGGFRNALGSLRSKGYIGGRDVLTATEEGLAALGNWEPLPEPGSALLKHWLGRLGQAEREILRVLGEAYPGGLSAPVIAERTVSAKGTPYGVDGGGFRNALGRLRTLELVTGRGELKASDDLFG